MPAFKTDVKPNMIMMMMMMMMMMVLNIPWKFLVRMSLNGFKFDQVWATEVPCSLNKKNQKEHNENYI